MDLYNLLHGPARNAINFIIEIQFTENHQSAIIIAFFTLVLSGDNEGQYPGGHPASSLDELPRVFIIAIADDFKMEVRPG